MLPERMLVAAALGAHEPRERLDEIDRRLTAGELFAKGRRRLIDAALARQGNRSYARVGGWGDYLQAEWSAGNLTEEEKRRYVRQSWSVEYELFPQQLGGGPGELPLSLEMTFRTRGRGGTSNAPSAQIGVQAISGKGWTLDRQAAPMDLVGKLSGNGMTSGTSGVGFIETTVKGVPAGAKATVWIRVWYSPSGGGPEAADAVGAVWTEEKPILEAGSADFLDPHDVRRLRGGIP